MKVTNGQYHPSYISNFKKGAATSGKTFRDFIAKGQHPVSSATNGINTNSASNVTSAKGQPKYESYSATDAFQSTINKLLEAGTIPDSPDEPIDKLSEQQIDELKKLFDPYSETDPLGRFQQMNQIFGKLVEYGAITKEEYVLGSTGTLGSMALWHNDSKKGWIGTLPPSGPVWGGPPDVVKANQASVMQWLEGASLIDKDNPIANDVSQARTKIYDYLLSAFGKPSEQQSFQNYLHNRGDYSIRFDPAVIAFTI